MRTHENLLHLFEALSVDLISCLPTLSNRLHVSLHLCPQIGLVQIDTHLGVDFDETYSQPGWNQNLTLFPNILSVDDILDVLMDRCIRSNAIVVHLVDQVRLSQVFWRLSDTFVHLELLGAEYLSFVKLRQLILLLLVPGEDFEPVLLLDRDATGMEILTTHADLHARLRQLSVLTDRREEVSCQQVVDAPLIIRQSTTLSVFDRMDRWMSFIIVFALLWSDPEFFIRDSARIIAKLSILRESRNDRVQVDGRVVPRCLCSGVAEESFVIKFLHVLHRLLG